MPDVTRVGKFIRFGTYHPFLFLTDFVAKKREMFLVQMALDVKKAEILKLDS